MTINTLASKRAIVRAQARWIAQKRSPQFIGWRGEYRHAVITDRPLVAVLTAK